MKAMENKNVFRPKRDNWDKNIDSMNRASYSQIEKAFFCGMSWYMRYVEKYKEEFSDNLARGSVYHSINEALYLEAFNTNGASFEYEDDKLVKIATDALDKAFPENYSASGLGEVEMIQAKNDIATYIPPLVAHYKQERLMPISLKNADGEEIPAIEIAIECPIEKYDGTLRDDFYIYVKIDLIAKNKEGKIIVLDHKTAGRAYSDMKIKIAQQLPIYAYAAGMIFQELGIPYDNMVRYDVITKTKELKIKIYEKTINATNSIRALTYLNAGCEMINKRALSFCNSEMSCNMCNYKDKCSENMISFEKFNSYITGNNVITDNSNNIPQASDQPISELTVKPKNKKKLKEEKVVEAVIEQPKNEMTKELATETKEDYFSNLGF